MFPVNRVREIFTAAMSCENASARKDLLNRECDGDKGLQEAVESLLFESTQTKSFLERPAVEAANPGIAPAEPKNDPVLNPNAAASFDAADSTAAAGLAAARCVTKGIS